MVFYEFWSFGGVQEVGGGGMDLALPWSPPGLETNEKLTYSLRKTNEKLQ